MFLEKAEAAEGEEEEEEEEMVWNEDKENEYDERNERDGDVMIQRSVHRRIEILFYPMEYLLLDCYVTQLKIRPIVCVALTSQDIPLLLNFISY